MQKKQLECVFIVPNTLRIILLCMKLTFVFTVLLSFQVSASLHSQTKLSLRLKNASYAEVFLAIEKETNFRFIYNDDILPLGKTLKVEAKNEEVTNLLNRILSRTPLSFKVVDRVIIITPDPTKSEMAVRRIKGRVVNDNGEPVSGASVLEKGTQNGTTTNGEGEFQLDVQDGEVTLEVSFVGYQSTMLILGESNEVIVTLKESVSGLNEVVVIGYGKTTQAKNVTAVSTLKGESLTNLPLPTVGDGLAGRVPGVIVTTSGGGPGKAPVVSIRGGGTPVYVIDDIISTEFDFRTLNINDIENISFLKDAGAAGIYGLVAGGGVVLVTTKRGVTGKMSARYDFSYDLSQPTVLGEKLSSIDAALWQNQVAQNSGQPLPYTEEMIQKYRDQSDPLNYSNTDWQKEVLKTFAPQKRHNVSLTAGSKQLQFYGSMGYFDQGTLYKFNTNWLKRYNYRMHITGNFEKIGLKTTLGIYGVSEELRLPSSMFGSSYFSTWSHIQNFSSFAPAYSNLERTRYTPYFDHPLAEIDPRSGYNRTENRNLNGLLNLIWAVPQVKGLELRVNGNFRQNQNWNKNWSATAPQYSVGSDVPIAANPPNLSTSAGSGYSYTLQALLGYDKTFAEKHTISLLGGYEEYYGYSENMSAQRTSYLFMIDQLFAGPSAGMQNNGSAYESSRAAYLGRARYEYDGKYIIEGSFRRDGNGNLFPEDKRWGFFPSGSVAWIISKEKFFDNINELNILNHFKLRASYGSIGQNSNAGEFAYIPGYSVNPQAYVIDGQLVPGFGNPGFASPDITWFSQKSANVGFDFASLNNRLSGTFDYFYNRTVNYLASPSGVGYTDPLGTSLPTVNSNGAFRRAGLEFSMKYNDRIGNLEYSVGANFVKFDQLWEVNPTEDSATLKNPYTRTTHQPGYYGAGLHAIGYYQSIQDILMNPTINSSAGMLAPGDLWYEDTNGDGKIDNADHRRIGANSFPRINYGITLDLKYRGWALNMLWQGSGSRSMYLGDVVQTGQVYGFQLDYWRPDNTHAQFPRAVQIDANGRNNIATSNYWLIDGRYLRLKALQVGYDFKKTLLPNLKFLTDLRLTLSGTNLLTFSPLNKYYLDAENGSTNNYDYPTQRVYSLAVNVGF